ncbi:MAG: quercetin dioxygenase-like cupin family protein [Methanobacteriota archaeon]|jgi:quercetin dioxygenase-like cupin family protein|uniref:Cupin n=1 Tax=Halorutilus salinus TaxID=2487751 RepID=A0A9Q4GHC4_9EURY|nr:cupin domain-containing protein [Halorutilus salinus]MCX2819712.1 cupin [Halorutilus salinus]
MPETSFGDERLYDDERFSARVFYSDGAQKTVLGYFEPRQFIPVHAPDSTLTVVVQDGDGTVRDGEDEHEVGVGDVVSVPAGVERGVRAGDEGLEALLVTSPPPTDDDHDKVREGLRKGVFEP